MFVCVGCGYVAVCGCVDVFVWIRLCLDVGLCGCADLYTVIRMLVLWCGCEYSDVDVVLGCGCALGCGC